MKKWIFIVAACAAITGARADDAIADTPASRQSQIQAAQKYPALSVAGSVLNKKFIATLSLWRTTNPQALQRDDWPMQIADSVAHTTLIEDGGTVKPPESDVAKQLRLLREQEKSQYDRIMGSKRSVGGG